MKQTSNQRITIDAFEKDPYPGKPKILFIGLSNSTHTHSWIDLLNQSEFNVRLFPSTFGLPPQDWKVHTYVTSKEPSEVAGTYRKNLYLTPIGTQRYIRKKFSFYFFSAARRGLNIFARRFKLPELYYDYTPKAESIQAWLAQVIRDWQPDIIHALGCFDSQGGEFLYETIKKFNLDYRGKVIMQLRGGSDLTLRRHDPSRVEKIKAICNLASQILSDNPVNFRYLEEMGISSDKFSPIAPLPGTGGIDLDLMQSVSTGLPSQRERVILYPKAYECIWSKALPAFEGIRLAWEKIRPCKIIMTAANEESQTWFRTLPEEIRQCCELLERISHDDLLKKTGLARVLLAPSLVDGIPNSLYEAMACGAFPIVSPLDTIKTVVENERNVLFARNLYPEDIVQALVRAMNDDMLVDTAAQNNLQLVKVIANRQDIRNKVQQYYHTLVKS